MIMDNAIDNYLETHAGEALSILKNLTSQPSIAAQNIGVDETASLVESLLKDVGFNTRQLIVEGAPPAIYGELQGGKAFTLLLYNHYDVQPPDPLDLWESPPFDPTERDGKLYARGVADNKGEIATRLVAICALKEASEELPITIRWIIEGEEEIGSPHFAALAEKYGDLLHADGCLWEGSGFDVEERPGLTLGTKGLLYVQFDVQSIGKDAHSGNAAFLPSAAWRLIQALASIRKPDGRVGIPGFYDPVRDPTPSEIEAMANQTNMDDAYRQAFQVDKFIDGVSGVALRKRASFEPTGNIAGILSGYSGEGVKTILPASAMAKMDFRLVPEQDPDNIFELLRDHLNKEGLSDIQVTKLGAAEPVVTPIDNPFIQRMIEISESFAGKSPSINPIGAGTLPLLGALRRYVGVPGLSAPGNPVYWANAAHAPNEHIRLNDLERAVRYNYYVLTRLGQD
jgi:acetylornithine deacetylase/succinyl-diaminopimelate desuccinylase-like protein